MSPSAFTSSETRAARARLASWLLAHRLALALLLGGLAIALTGLAMRAGLFTSTRELALAEVPSLAGSLDFVSTGGFARADAAVVATSGSDRTRYTPLVASAEDRSVRVLLTPGEIPAGAGRFVGLVARELPNGIGAVLAQRGLRLAPDAVAIDTHLTPEERRGAGLPVAGGGLLALVAGAALLLLRNRGGVPS